VTVGVSHDTRRCRSSDSHAGGKDEAQNAIAVVANCFCSPTPAAATGIATGLKTELQSQIADSLGLTLTIAHYSNGASKWNPIEHRLFSEISKKLGRRATRQLSEDPAVHPLHPHSHGAFRLRLS